MKSMKTVSGIITDWDTCPIDNFKKFAITGHVFKCEKGNDGDFIRTSEVVSFDEKLLLVNTKNSSYILLNPSENIQHYIYKYKITIAQFLKELIEELKNENTKRNDFF